MVTVKSERYPVTGRNLSDIRSQMLACSSFHTGMLDTCTPCPICLRWLCKLAMCQPLVLGLVQFAQTLLCSWAAQHNTWLLMKLTPKGVVFPFLCTTVLKRLHTLQAHAITEAHGVDLKPNSSSGLELTSGKCSYSSFLMADALST